MIVEVDEVTRQIIIMSLARLVIERPGWKGVLSDIARDFGDSDLKMFENFKKTGVHGSHTPCSVGALR